MSVEYINLGEYWFIMNRIAWWLVKNNKQFNTRSIYGYEGRGADYGTIIQAIKNRGDNVELDGLVAEFVECAIFDNKDLSFLPAYVTCSDGKTKLYLDTYVDMANRVSAYEVENGKSPNIIYIKNKTDKLYPYITQQGGGKLGQKTGYSCGPHSLMQCIYRLTGIELSESELMSVCGTTTSGTGHNGLETGLAWFNRKYGYNLKIDWFNFSELGNNQDERFNKVQEMINNGAVFFHLNYRQTWGHYEVIKEAWDDPLVILNSLGDSCSNGYCGYIEYRSRSEQVSYINGISQKSVAYLHR